MIEVEAPDGTTHEFPDKTDPSVIKKAMAKYVASVKPAPSAYAKKMADDRFSPPEDPVNHPLLDPLGDTGRAFKGAMQGIKEGAASAFPSAQETVAEDQANRDKYGNVLGTLKGAVVDPIGRLGSAATIPMNALAAASAPITGAIHSVGGTALAALPGMNKETADNMLDKAMIGIGPRGMEGGTQGVANAADAATAARAQESIAANAARVAQQPILAKAREAGYVITPAETKAPGSTANALSMVSGKLGMQQAASERNRAVTDSIVKADLGLPSDAHLDETTLDKVRDFHGGAYEQMKNAANALPGGKIRGDNTFLNEITNLDNMSDEFRADFPEYKKNPDVDKLKDTVLKQEFSGSSGIEIVKRLRDDSKTNLKDFSDPGKRSLGFAQRDAANAVEDLIDRNLKAAGRGNLVDTYRAARQQIAKTYDVESALDPDGHVDASKLAKLAAKGRPFTDQPNGKPGLKTVAEVARQFPKSMQTLKGVGGYQPLSIPDVWTGAMSGMATLGATHSDPAAAAAALAPLARPLARMTALGDRIQNSLLGLRQTNQGAGIGQAAAPAITAGVNQARPAVPTAPQQTGVSNFLRTLISPVQPPQQ